MLDIGCGWGGMALYLHQVAGVDVLGVTLSERQLKVARERAERAGVADHVKFELIDYRHVEEHVRPHRLGRHVRACRAAHYDEFFAKCRELAEARRGDAAPHHRQARRTGSRGPDPFTDKYIFPGYHLPALSEMVEASEKVRLIASDVENLRLHYALTLRHWLEAGDEGARRRSRRCTTSASSACGNSTSPAGS